MRFLTKICPILITMFLLCSCTTNKQAKRDTLRVAYFPNITHAQALVGIEERWFEKNLGEIDIVWREFNAGPAEIEALFAGEIDIGYIGPGPAINGFVKSNGEIRIIAGACGGGAILVGRKGLKITDVKQLRGKKISVPQFTNTQDLCLRSIMKAEGMKDTAHGGDVEVVQVNNPDVKTLLEKGSIDAAMLPEPWGSQLISDIDAEMILDYNKIWHDGMYSSAVVIVRNEFLKEHPEIVKKFIQTHVDLTEYINLNPEKAKSAINAQIFQSTHKTLKREILDSSFKRLLITYDPITESLKGFINLSEEMNFIKDKPDISKLLSTGILNQVLDAKGRKPVH